MSRNTITTKLTFKQVMPAVTKALGEERGKSFIEDPTAETADEIVNVVRVNLYKLAGIKVGRTSKTEDEDEAPVRRTRNTRTKHVDPQVVKFGRSVVRRISAGDTDVELSADGRRIVREVAREFAVARAGDERVFLKVMVSNLADMTDRKFNNLVANVKGDDSDEQAFNVAKQGMKWFRENHAE